MVRNKITQDQQVIEALKQEGGEINLMLLLQT